MSKIAKRILSFKYVIGVVFIIVSTLALFNMDNVVTNYDNSKYLPESSEATIALKEISKSLSDSTTVTVMIKNVDLNQVEVIKSKLEDLPQIKAVIFDESSVMNYKGNNALLTVLVEAKEYSKEVNLFIDEIRVVLNDYDYYLGGNAVNNNFLEKKIEEETPYILIIGIVVVSIILLLTTKSYFEPVSFGIVVGLAIIINLGTNTIFSEISYITKSVAAILQLGLSMDYSIILLHSYYQEKEKTLDNKLAMQRALTNSFKAITSSSLTTVIGLLALVFMSFTIGTDIGLVLAKGIIISLISVFLVLPNLILFFDKFKFNKQHKTLNLSNLSIRKSSKKFSFIFSSLSVIFIVFAFYLQSQNDYIFTDQTVYPEEEEIAKVFGNSNTFVFGIKNDENLVSTENLIIDEIEERYPSSVLSYLGVINTSKLLIDVDYLNDFIELNKAKFLLANYRLNHGYEKELSITEYIDTVSYLRQINEVKDEEVTEFNKISYLKENIDDEKTIQEITDELVDNNLIEANDKTNISILLGLYLIDNDYISTDLFTLDSYLRTVIEVNSNLFPVSNIEEISLLHQELLSLNNLLNQELTEFEFIGAMSTYFNTNLDDVTVSNIYDMYFASVGMTTEEKAVFKNILMFMVSNNMLGEKSLEVQGLLQIDTIFKNNIEIDNINDTLNLVVSNLTSSSSNILISNEINKIIYSLYVTTNINLDDIYITERDFIEYTSDGMSNYLPIFNEVDNTISLKLNLLKLAYDLINDSTLYSQGEVNTMFSDKTNDLQSLHKLTNYIYSISLSKDSVMEDYQVESKLLIDYVLENDLAESDDEITKVNDFVNEIEKVDSLIDSEELSLLIINTNFKFESKATRDFIEYINQDLLPQIDEKVYLSGGSVSHNDIKDYFEQDLLKINFITIGAILIVLGITFRSFIIPLILVFIIEGAIWTTLGFSYIFNENIFFIAYIIVGAIQLGATIDYAIILTTNYQKERITYDKKNALVNAMKKSTSAILTSGTILVIAGFCISIVSTQASIVSVGSFLGRGTLISVIFVLTVLPSFLYTLDKYIIKRKKRIS